MVKKITPKYSFIFEKTVSDFARDNRLYSEHICCAVSGGVDSVALAFLASRFLKKGMIKKLSILHIDHGTRPQIKEEKQLVKSLAKTMGAEFISKKLKGLKLNDPSFEDKARKMRQEVYKSIPGVVWCAHHLDDSFEWSLKTSFSSSAYQAFRGIPVRSPLVLRPFLTVTKEQIKKYAKQNQLKWLNDSSNEDIDFERAYIRKKIIPAIKKRYPQYLKHYARQSQAALESEGKTYELAGSQTHHFLLEPESKLDKKSMRFAIKRLSKTNRGKIELQIQKIQDMLSSAKMGPMSFSGGVEVYNLSHHLIVVNKQWTNNLKTMSFQLMTQSYDYKSYKMVFEQLLKTDSILACWAAISRSESRIDEYKGGHPLLPLSLRAECQLKDMKLVSAWKLLRHLRSNPSKQYNIAIIK